MSLEIACLATGLLLAFLTSRSGALGRGDEAIAQLYRELNGTARSRIEKLRAQPIPICAPQPNRQSSTTPAHDPQAPGSRIFVLMTAGSTADPSAARSFFDSLRF